jgi:hypothetical protein
VSLFYVLPPRAVLGDSLADLLHAFFPGLTWDEAGRRSLAEALAPTALELTTAHTGGARDVYVVHREDLPTGEALARALTDGYGAESGDEVIEVRPGARAGEMTTRRWLLSETT